MIQPINRHFESNLAATRGVTATLIYKYETRPGEEQNVQVPKQPTEKKLPSWFSGELQTFQIEQGDGSFLEKQGFHDSQVSALLLDATNEQSKLYGENCAPLKFNQILTDYANIYVLWKFPRNIFTPGPMARCAMRNFWRRRTG